MVQIANPIYDVVFKYLMNADKLAAVFRRSEAEIKEILNQARSGN